MVALAGSLSLDAFAHTGKTNSQGCHKQAATGDVHCHESKRTRNQEGYTSTKYNRDEWDHWLDTDGDCKDTRAEVLIRDSKVPVKYNKKGCRVVMGVWYDKATGKKFFRASDVDIDHHVSIAHAHYHGGSSWSLEKKAHFANDMENLTVMDDDTNQRDKKHYAPHKWMPSNKDYHCEYIKKWVEIKDKYKLRYGSKEQKKINAVLKQCG